MRSVLVGSIESSRRALVTMVEAGYPPQLVVTLEERFARRHSDYCDLAPVARRAGIDVVRVDNVNDPAAVDRIAAAEPDFLFVIGWSQICRPRLLSVPRYGTVGYHPSQLPANRGRAVIPWTIIQGIDQTAGSLFWIDEGMDSGDLLAQHSFPVAEDETATSLYGIHIDVLARMLREVLPDLDAGHYRREPQDHAQASYCAKRTPRDGWIDWTRSAREVWTLIRATTHPYPGARTTTRGRLLLVWDAELVGPGPYWGLHGQVQAVDHHGALVQCGDRRHVRLGQVQLAGDEADAASTVLRLHERLGHVPEGPAGD